MRRKNVCSNDLKMDIANAFFELIKENDDSKVTIESLTKKANVGRATYFRHFEGKEDIVCFKLCTLWEEYVVNHKIDIYSLSIYDWTKCYFDFNLEIKEYIDLIYKIGLSSCILNSLKDVIQPLVDKENVFTEREMEFYCNGVVGLLDYWKKDGYKETIEELIDFLKGRFN